MIAIVAIIVNERGSSNYSGNNWSIYCFPCALYEMCGVGAASRGIVEIFPACFAGVNPFCRQENGSQEAGAWASRGRGRDEGGEERLQCTRQQPGGDRKGNEKKPQCAASGRASSPADSRLVGSLGELEIALISLVFP